MGSDHPKVGDKIGKRTIIRVMPESILFGQDETRADGTTATNCGAYLTSYREWFAYDRSVDHS